MSQTHELKIWPEYFRAVDSGAMNFNIRKADRPFEVGDNVFLREWDPVTEAYTGHVCYRHITYIFPRRGRIWPGLAHDQVILGFAPVSRDPGAHQ